jgi:tripeptide aminopeptidase
MKTQQFEPLPPVVQRFLRYVAVDTQAVEGATEYPSSDKQKHLGQLLVEELLELGLPDAVMDEWGCVTATLERTQGVGGPVIGWIAHMDTSPEVSGANVMPMTHSDYQGGALTLAEGIEIHPDDSPALNQCHGHDIITSDGTTLLGADNKAGVAAIISAVAHLLDHPELPHTTLRLAFTCDEEIGRGTLHFDVDAFGAEFAYTVDGETVGEIENETFCADMVVLTIKGRNVHPGYAKGKLVNALKAASAVVLGLPQDEAPETTELRQGYLHPISITGGVEEAEIKLIVRDFDDSGLERLEKILESIVADAEERFEGAVIESELRQQYRNMRPLLEETPEVVELAMEAVRQAGGEPKLSFARGGTDGAMLSFKGLPTPNIFTGGHNFHSKREWISVQDLSFTVKTLIELAQLASQS